MLATVAQRIGGTPGQVIFKWAHAKGFVVVTTTERRTRLDEYLAVFDLRAFPSPSPLSRPGWLTHRAPRWLAGLTPDEIEAIDEAGALGPPSDALEQIMKPVRTLLLRRWTPRAMRVALGASVVLLVVMFLRRLGWLALLCVH